MDYLPLFLDVRHQLCLVVGGGDVALRKIRLLLSAGAIIRVVSPSILQEVQSLLRESDHQLYQRSFHKDDLDSAKLVIAATSDRRINHRVSRLARERKLLVNVVDDGEAGNAIMPSIVDRSPVIAAFSTGGKAPVLARQLRENLESTLPAHYGDLAELAGRYRNRVIARYDHINQRRQFWEEAFSGSIAEKVFKGDIPGAENELEQQLRRGSGSRGGEVYLIGAGPGDPELLTFKALRLMQKADVVLYDNLVSKEVVELCRRDADLIYVGKKSCQHAYSQESINTMMVELAQEGKRVARLKGGDPFIFGRGGEELEALAEYSIPFQIVPGITAASGCASYAGIPLTHRDYAQSAQFITGHCKLESDGIDWSKVKDKQQTLVFYMGVRNLTEICQKLVDNGVESERPVAIVHKGTTPLQKTVTGTVETISELAAQQDIKPPSLIIVGDVVRLQKRLEWFQPDVTMADDQRLRV